MPLYLRLFVLYNTVILWKLTLEEAASSQRTLDLSICRIVQFGENTALRHYVTHRNRIRIRYTLFIFYGRAVVSILYLIRGRASAWSYSGIFQRDTFVHGVAYKICYVIAKRNIKPRKTANAFTRNLQAAISSQQLHSLQNYAVQNCGLSLSFRE